MPRAVSLALALLAVPVAAAGPGDQVRVVGTAPLPNVPGKSITGVLVNYAPDGRSGAHHHAGSVMAFVLTGAI